MKVAMNKCEMCGRLFDDDKKYEQHLEKHRAIEIINGMFPEVEDVNCEFANGGWNVQRNKSWLARYKRVVAGIIEEVGDADGIPFTYGWYRCLDDGGSMFYAAACRVMNICPDCFREWGQAFYANKCECVDKKRAS